MSVGSTSAQSANEPIDEAPTRALEFAVAENFQFIWRTLRRLGVRPEAQVDDATQRVFEIAARKRAQISPGHERAFFFKTAVLVAKEECRSSLRHHRELGDEVLVEGAVDPAPLPDRTLEERRYRAMLDSALDSLGPELRTVFVLYELEGLSSPEIADLLELPLGTVASRLRRSRSAFESALDRLRARLDSRGGTP